LYRDATLHFLWADAGCHEGLQEYFGIEEWGSPAAVHMVAYKPGEMLTITNPKAEYFSEASASEFIQTVLDGSWELKVTEKVRPIEEHVDGHWDQCYPGIPKDWAREWPTESSYDRYENIEKTVHPPKSQ